MLEQEPSGDSEHRPRYKPDLTAVLPPCRVCLAEVYQDKALVGDFMNRKGDYEDPKVGPPGSSGSACPEGRGLWVPVSSCGSRSASAGLTTWMFLPRVWEIGSLVLWVWPPFDVALAPVLRGG